MKGQIKIFPVGNGDQVLISADENNYRTNIMVDCKIRDCSEGDSDKSKFDVKADLLKVLNKKSLNSINDVAYTDIFVLSHGDDDHLHGFDKHFYTGAPNNFKQKHKNENKIFIDVLWFSPMVMGECNNYDEECFNKEAKRRIQLHRDNNIDKDVAGNRIVIIGYDENEDLSDLNLVRKVPGDIVTRFNNRDLTTFSIFIHAPYKVQLCSASFDRNHTSIVFQARFKESAASTSFAALAMFGGDSDHYAWSIILEKTKKFQKHVIERALDWDLFLAPHHCSWSFFNDRPQEEHPEPQKDSLEILDYKRSGGKIIASSKTIIDDDDNPPHFEAKQEYLKKLDSKSDFLNTAIEPIESAPEPIVFEISSEGIKKVDVESEAKKLAAAISVASSAIIKKPWCR